MPKKNVPPAPTEEADLKALLFQPLELKNWYEKGACFATENPDFFDFEQERIDEAKKICNTCEVRVHCLKDALGIGKKTGQYEGVWGGYSPEQRKRLKRMYLHTRLSQRRASGELV